MGRKKKSIDRPILPDVRYGSALVSRFVNNMMLEGKKNVSLNIFYGAMDLIQGKMSKEDPLRVFERAIENVKPMLEVKSRRVGGANYQIPVEVSSKRREALAIKWLIHSSRSRPERTMKERLSIELMDAFNQTGISMKKREDTHRMAEANRAFAHYRW